MIDAHLIFLNGINKMLVKILFSRISFIGHSLGGLILRAALPFLPEYADKMYTFITMGSPHLGYLYNSSTLIEAGFYL
jgi:triacylglycerol esterase/lipase EstA (alpha/beta hydrolase family)